MDVVIAISLLCSLIIAIDARKTRLNPLSGTACEDDFLCDSGECIPLDWVCDQYGDCAGGEDEADCCVDENETDCIEYTCPDDTYPCGSGVGKSCIPISWVCDGTEDCDDGSDEINAACGVTEAPPVETEPPIVDTEPPVIETEAPPVITESPGGSECPDDRFGCVVRQTWKCLPQEWVCDGEEDCRDAEDEDPDMCSTECTNCAEVCTMELQINMALYGFNDEVLDRHTLQTCQDECLQRPTCLSIDFVWDSGRCYLSTDSAFTQPDHFGPHHGSNYAQKNCVMEY